MTTFELVIGTLILILFILGNFFFSIGFFVQKRVYSYLNKRLKIEEKTTLSKLLKIVNLTLWLIVGIIFLFTLDIPLSLEGVLIFLAFRSGLTLSKRVVFGIHDIKIMKLKLSEERYVKLASRAVMISTSIELIFVLAWGILYRYISITVKSSIGIGVNDLVILLWFSGFVYGFIFSLIVSIVSKKLLLKSEIGIILLLSGVILKDRFETRIKGFKFFRSKEKLNED